MIKLPSNVAVVLGATEKLEAAKKKVAKPPKSESVVKYEVGDRVVVNLHSKKDPQYFLATIKKISDGLVIFKFDDGTTEEHENTSSVIGLVGKKKYKEMIEEKDLGKFLLPPKEIEDSAVEVKPSKKEVADAKKGSKVKESTYSDETIEDKLSDIFQPLLDSNKLTIKECNKLIKSIVKIVS